MVCDRQSQKPVGASIVGNRWVRVIAGNKYIPVNDE